MHVSNRIDSFYLPSRSARSNSTTAESEEHTQASERGPLARAADNVLAGVLLGELSLGKAGSWIGGRRAGEALGGKLAEWTGADPERSRLAGATVGRGMGAGVIGAVVFGGLAVALGRSGPMVALTAVGGFSSVASCALLGEVFKNLADRYAPEAAQQLREKFD